MPQRRMLLVGDSLVGGLAPYLKGLVEPAGWGFTSASNVGKSTRWYGQQNIIASLVAQHAPQLVVIVLGTNDGGAESTPDRYRQFIADVVAQTGDAKVIWVGPPTIPRSAEDDRGSAARNRILADCPGIQAVDGRAMTDDLNAHRTPDGVHFTQAGSKIWAGRIFALIQNVKVKTAANWKRVVGVLSLVGLAVAGVFYWKNRRS